MSYMAGTSCGGAGAASVDKSVTVYAQVENGSRWFTITGSSISSGVPWQGDLVRVQTGHSFVKACVPCRGRRQRVRYDYQQRAHELVVNGSVADPKLSLDSVWDAQIGTGSVRLNNIASSATIVQKNARWPRPVLSGVPRS